jgi:hypothetical protein
MENCICCALGTECLNFMWMKLTIQGRAMDQAVFRWTPNCSHQQVQEVYVLDKVTLIRFTLQKSATTKRKIS